jgi:hypothetical protein
MPGDATAAARAEITAVPVPAAGHDARGRCHVRAGGTCTVLPTTGRTLTGLPAPTAGA